MGFPVGMQLATVAFGIPLTATGKDVVTKVSVKPTSTVIWAATGQPIPAFSDSFTAEGGQLGSFQVPFVDQAGFIDLAGNEVTDFAFQISASWEFANERPINWNKNLKPLLGQTGTIDLDLVPDGPVSIPVTAPTAAVLGFNGRTGFITLTDADLPDRLQEEELSAAVGGIVDSLALPISDYSTNTIGAPLKTAVLGTKPTVVFTSNSIGYGQDNTATGTLPPVNGSSQNRSETPPIESFNSMMAFIQSASSGVTTINQAYPGDQTQLGTGNAYTRWAGGVSGDVEIFFCLDTNDAMNYGGFAGGVLTPAQSAEGLAKLIRRCNQRGSQAIVVGGAPVSDSTHNRTIRAYTAAHASVAARLGVTFIDVAELLDTLPSNDLWTDNVHLSKYAYSLIGRRVAAILGRYGTLPRRVAPGITIKPKHGVHGGGSPTTRSGAIDGTVVRLTAGQSLVIPVKVEAPCVPILRLWSETATGTGSGAIIYNAGPVSGAINRTVNIPVVTGGSSLLRAHALNLGMDNITISCTSGALEFEGVTFIDLPGRNSCTSARRIEESTLSGLTLGTPGGPMDATWDAVVDEQTTLSPYGNAANVDAKVDFRVSIAEPTSGLLAGVGISAASNYGSTVLLKSGYIAFRNSSNALVVRELDQGTVTDTTVASTFAAGEFNGVISMAVSATTGNLVVYVNGVAKATITSKWRHYTPIAWANTGTILTVHTCSVRTSTAAP